MGLPFSFSKRVPAGDNRERRVCDGCCFVDYVNPKIVVGAVATWEDRLLLCKRAIEPRLGYWTVPAGFMEERESVEEGAAREAFEEAGADLEIGPLLGVWSVPRHRGAQALREGTGTGRLHAVRGFAGRPLAAKRLLRAAPGRRSR